MAKRHTTGHVDDRRRHESGWKDPGMDRPGIKGAGSQDCSRWRAVLMPDAPVRATDEKMKGKVW